MTAMPSMSSMPLMPAMPELKYTAGDEDDAEDEKEEAKLMGILMKLKEAKSHQEASRKRKRNHVIMDEVKKSFKDDNRNILAQHRRKWKAKLTQLEEHASILVQKVKGLKEGERFLERQFKERFGKQKEKVEHLIHERAKLQEDITARVSRQAREKLANDAACVKTETMAKVQQLQNVLKQVIMDNKKEDKFSKLVKTVMLI